MTIFIDKCDMEIIRDGMGTILSRDLMYEHRDVGRHVASLIIIYFQTNSL